MYHYLNAIIDAQTGTARIGYFGRVLNTTTNAVIPIYADDSGTPVSVVSGIANMAKTDTDGNLSFFVAPGTYHIDLFDTDGETFIRRFSEIPMTSTEGEQGDPGPEGPPGPADAFRVSLAALKGASTSDGKSDYDGSTWFWTLGDYSATPAADIDVNIVKSDSVPLSTGAWVRQLADAVSYRAPGSDSVTQSAADTVRRERLNLYDKIPRNLWNAIEAGTNTADLSAYVMAAIQTGRGINARTGRFRIAANLNFAMSGASIRGEGRDSTRTVFENVDNRPVFKLDSSSANLNGFVLEDAWVENRDPGSFPTCDLLKITGAGDGETYSNDKHAFNNVWFFRGRDNISCDKRSIWTIFSDVNSTGASRDAIHIESDANVNQWSLRDVILKGSGRNALFIKHDFSSLMTGWSIVNGSFEDSGAEAVRITGAFGVQGLGFDGCTFENNAQVVAPGASGLVDGIRRRKAQIHSDASYFVGTDINRTTFYNNFGGTGGNPDVHVYVSASDASGNPVVACSGEIRNSRFLITQVGGNDVIWPIGLTYGANNLNAGPVMIDETRQSIDLRKFTASDNYTATLTLTGVTAAAQGVARFVRQGDLVTAYFPTIAGTSNTTDATLTGLPAALWPVRAQTVATIVQDGAAGIVMGLSTIGTDGVITLFKDVGGGAFANTGTKGIRLQTLTWAIS